MLLHFFQVRASQLLYLQYPSPARQSQQLLYPPSQQALTKAPVVQGGLHKPKRGLHRLQVVQRGLLVRKPGLHQVRKPGLHQLPQPLPTPQVMVMVPHRPPRATALVAQTGATIAVFNNVWLLLVVPLLLTRPPLLPASVGMVALALAALAQELLILSSLPLRRVSFVLSLLSSMLRLETPSSSSGELTTTLSPNLPSSLLVTKHPIILLLQENRTRVSTSRKSSTTLIQSFSTAALLLTVKKECLESSTLLTRSGPPLRLQP